MEANNLTARAPRPTSRKEAQAAFESSLLGQALTSHIAKLGSAHNAKFNKALKMGHTPWGMFAKKTYPNRGEIIVENFDGELVRVSIMRYMDDNSVAKIYKWRIQEDVLPDHAHRQWLWWNGVVNTTSPWTFVMGKRVKASVRPVQYRASENRDVFIPWDLIDVT